MTKLPRKYQKIILTLGCLMVSWVSYYYKVDLSKQDVASLHRVVRVVDGDTLKVSFNNEEKTVRLIGINTPESVDPRRPVQCFGNEASSYMKKLVANTDVVLEYDETQGSLDKYGRTLAYVFLADGTFVNRKMIEEGYAFEYTYNLPYKYQKDFKDVEKDARGHERGLWNTAVCSYK